MRGWGMGVSRTAISTGSEYVSSGTYETSAPDGDGGPLIGDVNPIASLKTWLT
jgi:hypothetical protein